MGNKSKLLTEAELELMTVLWKIGEGSVNDVLDHLPRGKAPAYTTVSTILRILEQKKFVKARKEGRGHVYLPALAKADYEARSVKHMVESVFEGAPVGLARHLFRAGNLSAAELNELRSLLDGLEKKA